MNNLAVSYPYSAEETALSALCLPLRESIVKRRISLDNSLYSRLVLNTSIWNSASKGSVSLIGVHPSELLLLLQDFTCA
jgi:hypothetical protein